MHRHHHPPDADRDRGVNGHDLHIGQTLGHLLAHASMQTRHLERMASCMETLPERTAQAMSKPSKSPDRSSFLDRGQWIVAAAIVALAVLGKHELATALIKALGQ